MGVKGGFAKIFYLITGQNIIYSIIQIAKHCGERRSGAISRIAVVAIGSSWVLRSFGDNAESKGKLQLNDVDEQHQDQQQDQLQDQQQRRYYHRHGLLS